VVCSALVIGDMNRGSGAARAARAALEQFWELINELLNAVLFVYIGLAVLVFTVSYDKFRGGMLAIPTSLLGRFLGIWAAVWVFGFRHEFTKRGYWLMTWGGIRGGISVALALSLPASQHQDFVLTITYVTVVFSIVFQGLTVGWFVEK
jgi:CPA1 family monovalent cation:H+ antiporter